MIIFRLISFAMRIIASFVFVFILQIQFAGKSLESYLNNFGSKFIVTKALKKASKDGSKLIKELSFSDKQQNQIRKLSSSQTFEYIKHITDQVLIPDSENQKDNQK